MEKSRQIFDNNNENIKIIGKPRQMKIPDLSTILYLHHCSEVIIRQYPNVKCFRCTVKHWKRMRK